MHVRFWDLGNREVINCKDGKKLGCVGDVEIDLGKPAASPVSSSRWGVNTAAVWGRKGEYRIPYGCVVKIGVDIILVDIEGEEMFCEAVNGDL